MPVRIELGPQDLEKQQLVTVRRFDGQKGIMAMEGAAQAISSMLDDIHNAMFAK